MSRAWIVAAALTVGGFGCGDSSGDGSGGGGGTGLAGMEVSLGFAAKVGDDDFACGETYDELGATDTSLELVDFRFYVHGVALRNLDGDWVEVDLAENNFQTGTVALLDFEDGCGEVGNSQLNDVVSGSVPEGDYQGIRFQMGVPFDMNHVNEATQPPPMNVTPMFWAWQTGYKFLRIDAAGFSSGGWRMHLGSGDCQGDPELGETVSCTFPNQVDVELLDFDPSTDTIVADFKALVAGQDLSDIAPMPPGCMSGPTDRDCVEIFANLGLPFEGNPAGQQSFFAVE